LPSTSSFKFPVAAVKASDALKSRADMAANKRIDLMAGLLLVVMVSDEQWYRAPLFVLRTEGETGCDIRK
jgi:hypothetical protein